ncbi:hypothetical protein TNCV_768641 [Trichonephila clavipes]|nr:hypothetical protein TNCV_768641 [Trichonephila clavipes]
MNSPDYDDFIDKFSVPAPISPLLPTPVASPSHEPSQDVIYDSLPPMEQSTVPESPLKDLLSESPLKDLLPESPLKDLLLESPLKDLLFKSPLKDSLLEDSKPPVVSMLPVVSRPPEVFTPVKKAHVKKVDSVIHRSPRSRERRNEERRKEERRPRDPRLYRRSDFRPQYRRPDFKPSVFRRPPYVQQLMPTSQENAQVFFHGQGLAVLCIRNSGFLLTNRVFLYARDRECPNELFKFLHYLNVGTICVTDQHSKQKFKKIQVSWISSSQSKRTPVMLLNSNGHELGQCPFWNQTICHRWIAVQGMCAILHQSINPIFHS